MTRFRKRPVVVEAWPVAELLRSASTDWLALPQQVRDLYEQGNLLFHHDAVVVLTLEGTMRGERGDWIICGVQGELYPCKPDIFEQTYEPANTAPEPELSHIPDPDGAACGDWRLIETAPKDGTVILVARDMGEPWDWVLGHARWVDDSQAWVKVAGWIAKGFGDPPGELGLAHPTHWTHLPPPPEGQEEP